MVTLIFKLFERINQVCLFQPFSASSIVYVTNSMQPFLFNSLCLWDHLNVTLSCMNHLVLLYQFLTTLS